MNNKLDVFEILNVNNKKNQEQQNAPDFNFLNVRELLMQEEKEAAPKPEPKPVPKPEPKPAPKPQPKPAPKPEPKPVAPPPKIVIEQHIEPEQKPAPKTGKKRGKSFIKLLVLMAVIVLFLTFVAGVQKVTMNSMDPMISSGDHVAVNKLARNYGRGDIIVFRSASGEKLTARIVAVKGDVVDLNNIGGLYINNELQNEENIHTVTAVTDTAVTYPVIVDEGTYFVLGDNRTDSIDSRSSDIGLVDEKDIIGKVIFCFKKI